ncbi:ubiquitin carboxyl-terminal hydrolase 47-like [Centruroides sculpturatus]|uniref:ubiquitin carboxyl-terminal hydrolase 47-like n=1 Tax=Centruroides sculpturatus TaxID=218467 RepID=UPI000C6DE8EE|nr:ubiquitin carboxyl-terminal hydrolase 47-like [Centruroides sculpturatus]
MVPGENTQMVPVEGSLCAADEPRALCIVRDMTNAQSQNWKITLNLPASTTAEQLVEEVGKKCHYHPDSFEIVLQRLPDMEPVVVNEEGSHSLEELGFRCGENARNILIISNKNGEPPRKTEFSDDKTLNLEKIKSENSNSKASGSSEVISLPPSVPPYTSSSSAFTSPPPSIPPYSPNSTDFSYGYNYSSSLIRQETVPFSSSWVCFNASGRVVVNEEGSHSLEELGFRCGENARNILIISNKNGEPPRKTEFSDDKTLNLEKIKSENSNSKASGSSEVISLPPSVPPYTSSSSAFTSPPPSIPPYSPNSTDFSYGYNYSSSLIRQETEFVGLVNQAMTCYLNSLLQTLYMTPEFRNALYRWEFDGTEEEGVKSIPFQLQKLFMQLQTSKKPAVGTTELTTSFGWDSSEAWQQHDVQELCRVMFDALEQKFKDTEQADLISRYYEGKLKDYVKCLECGYESAREDTFLDIPLVVRPFGSTQAYGSVEEALRAFVTPETLEGSNQYFCEQCNKKCDAHKGLKFIRFPYLLTLQLKRFDFDPVTMHRIKLNDRVTFPEILNLNEFLKPECELESPLIDDGDTTDSGSALDDDNACYQGSLKVGSSLSSEGISDEVVDEDEGIDLASNGQSMISNSEVSANERNLRKSMEKGPYVYELFSIMVHSGSANGGHYYAYIKSFKDGHWYCFNDAQVTRITYDDIRKTYGGGTARGYYSSAYSSKENTVIRNYDSLKLKIEILEPISVEEFPEHIKALLQSMQEQEERERQQRELDRIMCKIKLFCQHPLQNRMVEMRLKVNKDCTLAEATATAHKIMGLEGTVPVECCRLVKYDEFHDSLECSFEGCEEQSMEEILGGVKSSYKFDLLLEIRKPHERFEEYKIGGTTVKVHVIDVENEEISPFITIRGHLNESVEEFKQRIAQVLGVDATNMRVVLEMYRNDLRYLSTPNKTLKSEGFSRSSKVFVEYKDTVDAAKPFPSSKFYQILDRYENTICIHVALPRVDKEVLQRLGIPSSNEGVQNCKEESDGLNDSGLGDRMGEISSLDLPKNSPILVSSDASQDYDEGLGDGEYCDSSNSYLSAQAVHSDQSEDSSLTDSERTLVGDELSPRNNSPDLMCNEIENDPEPHHKVSELLNGTNAANIIVTKRIEYESVCNSSSSCSPDNEPCEDDRNLSSPEENTRDYNKAEKDSSEVWQSDGFYLGEQAKNEIVKRYFRAWPYTDIETGEKMLRVYVDKRITLGNLKKELERWIGVAAQYFKIYRLYSNNQEFECMRMAENLTQYGDDTRLTVKLGRVLGKGEYHVKIYQLLINEQEPCKFLIDFVFSRGMTVLQAKKEILPEIREKCFLDIPLNRCRLRKKSWKNPGTIFLDHLKFEDDIPITTNWEIFLEVLTGAEQVTSKSQVAVFCRRWNPSKFQLDPFEEIILENRTINELKSKLSEISKIPIDNLEFAKGQGTFPCEPSLLSIHTDFDWHSQASSLNTWPLYISDDGHVIFYRDKTEELKQLSEEEKRQISNKENTRMYDTVKDFCLLLRCRLRKKSWKNPGTIFLDHLKFEDDIPITTNWEIFLEVLTGAEQVTSKSQVAVFCRRWNPSKFQLDPFEEIILENRTINELKSKLSEISKIPIDNLEFAKGQGTFPCEPSLLSIHTDFDWHSQASSLNTWPLYISDDGHVIFYRDKTEELKQLSEEEKRQISNKENTRLNKLLKVNYSPRKERALKIYTDSSPSSTNSNSSNSVSTSKTIVPDLD